MVTTRRSMVTTRRSMVTTPGSMQHVGSSTARVWPESLVRPLIAIMGPMMARTPPRLPGLWACLRKVVGDAGHDRCRQSGPAVRAFQRRGVVAVLHVAHLDQDRRVLGEVETGQVGAPVEPV